jgi:hypothetical protein
VNTDEKYFTQNSGYKLTHQLIMTLRIVIF